MLRGPGAVPALVAAAMVLLLGALSGCSAGSPQPTAPSPAPPTPIARLNTAQLDLHRIPFCDLVPGTAVTDALGQRATSRDSWGMGDPASFLPGRGDRVQELGCRFGAGSSAAAAWVFASPVQPGFARNVVADSASRNGCREEPAATFGKPSELQDCRLAGGVVRVRHAGLFGQTWLTCQVSAALPVTEVTRRADAWCVQVANVLNSNH